ncbi:MAG TPA: response regulator [Methylomirabilota bacterium]|jgi:DNA-binding response OmpR family regulator|nr:response regulator [Methylomirabilota bacterium]
MSAEPSGRRRILVVDDDERERVAAARALGEAGHAVDTAASKAEVVALLAKHDYDLVLSDLKMPELNGPAFYQVLKECCRGTTPPVIFSIERGYTPEYANFLMRLAAPVLMKPVPAADLCLAVGRLLPPRPAPPQAASTLAS